MMWLLTKGFVKRYLARRGYSIVQEPSLWDFFEAKQIDLVIDVGANEGQFAREIRSMGYRGRILSFEPLPAAFQILSSRAADDPLWKVVNAGVGAAPGKLQINVAKNSVFSSFRPLTSLAEEFDRDSQTVEQISVPVVTLDDFASESDANAPFLKCDTQGFEQEVLAGAAALLKRCAGLQLELPVDHLYADVWTFKDAIAELDKLGFVPAQFRTVNPRRGDKGSALEFDGVFRRKGS